MDGGAAPAPDAGADAADDARARWLAGPWPWRGYALGLASMAALDLLLWGVFAVLAGAPGAILLRLPEALLFLVGLNLAGGWMLFRPVARWLRGAGPAEPALERLGRLAALSGWWALAVAAAFSASAFLITPFLVHGLPMTPEIVALLTARAMAWCVLLPYVAYFLVADHVRRLRRLVCARRGLSAPPGDGALSAKIALAVAGGAAAPGASIAVTLALVPPVSPITGQPRELLIVVTLIGAAAALGAAFWALRRSLRSSLGALTEGMARVGAGARDVRLAVQTDDELGRLAAHFNALTAALSASEAEARRAETRFHESQKHVALGRLAAGVAHDFNNILAIVMGYADLTRRRLPPEDRNRARMDEIVAAAERGKALIGQILAFTRARAPERTRVDLRANVAETVDWLRAAMGAGLRIETRLPEAPVPVLGEATALHQIVANLCVNAAHAMRGRQGAVRVALDVLRIDGGRAEGMRARLQADGPALLVEPQADGGARAFVGVLRPGGHARVTVADEGCGMEPSVLACAFEPYFTTKPVGEGTGLGLAAVLGLVAQHGGAITVATRAGEGTRFEIFLPLATD